MQPVLGQTQSVRLEELTWKEAAAALTPQSIVMIPLGASAKEHGPHLKLSNDFVMAQYLTKEVTARTRVIVAPTVNYNFYPAFLEYPGSRSLRFDIARDVIVDVCRSLAHFGPQKFYVLNTGVSTIVPLKAALDELSHGGVKISSPTSRMPPQTLKNSLPSSLKGHMLMRLKHR